MKKLFTIIAFVPFFSVAQTTFPPGVFSKRIDSFTNAERTFKKGNKMPMPDGDSVAIKQIEIRSINSEQGTFAATKGGYYFPLDEVAKRYTVRAEGSYTSVADAAIPRIASQADSGLKTTLFTAGTELEKFSKAKGVSFLIGIAGAGVAVGTGVNNGKPGATANNAGYYVSGGLMLLSLIISLNADSRVGTAGKILRIASGHIPINYRKQ